MGPDRQVPLTIIPCQQNFRPNVQNGFKEQNKCRNTHLRIELSLAKVLELPPSHDSDALDGVFELFFAEVCSLALQVVLLEERVGVAFASEFAFVAFEPADSSLLEGCGGRGDGSGCCEERERREEDQDTSGILHLG
jgi:hypothetical protein